MMKSSLLVVLSALCLAASARASTNCEVKQGAVTVATMKLDNGAQVQAPVPGTPFVVEVAQKDSGIFVGYWNKLNYRWARLSIDIFRSGEASPVVSTEMKFVGQYSFKSPSLGLSLDCQTKEKSFWP